MGGFSDYLEAKVLNVIFGKATFTSPNIWAGLCTAAISDTDTGATASTLEPNTGAYARVAVVASSWSTSATSGAISNIDAITFVTATASWGTITHCILCDASVAGNLLAYASVAVAKAVGSSDTAQFAAGDFDILLS